MTLDVGPYQATNDEIASIGLEPARFKAWLLAVDTDDDWLEVLEQYFKRRFRGLTGDDVYQDFIRMGMTQAASEAASARISKEEYGCMEPQRWAFQDVKGSIMQAWYQDVTLSAEDLQSFSVEYD
mmetsp:Transcript_38349/g.85383  ORF Transcript_38349/g.85383 Transcript_38349/m.85383 type:complete len:125 (+) Transcript_38349:877-1251(+)|eukprot:CAMPEP_0202923402 /NCGR_PEP_ID=MMETSP1392-20130828/78430_1 /ASSEMBLY_ACC=CAM_ASM_000868 /TAXON_ID=225041 /ORGANISM="Chlamydomonas chlamydogama, Strain SAG 11-48b" /LENGTH=124 /DNA_ID=CAMNT_0049617081 /DNA_START=760 /DNA_END=1134 /DNA_ORIENTATION=-